MTHSTMPTSAFSIRLVISLTDHRYETSCSNLTGKLKSERLVWPTTREKSTPPAFFIDSPFRVLLRGYPIANLKKKILAYLSQHSKSSFAVKDLSRQIKAKGREGYHELRNLLEELRQAGLVTLDERGRISYNAQRRSSKKSMHPISNRMIGQLSVTRRGAGFVKVEGLDEDIAVAPKFMKTALNGDIVAVVPFARVLRTHRKKGGDRVEAEIVEVIKRANTTVVGRLEKSRDFFFVVPDDARISRDIYIGRNEAGKANPRDKVLVQLLPWLDEHLNPEGTVLEVLGPSGDARVEILSVAKSFGLPMTFSPDALKEAEQFRDTISSEDIRSRVDFRSKVCFTIDPEDARDFDDAISFEELDDGIVRLGVHIADVSHYVREGNPLDAEAFARGTSVYLVNEVIPMLPEHLSNDLCSLRPNVDRLTYSVFLEVNKTGNVQDYQISKSIIRSARRYSYEEVQAILGQKSGEFAEIILPLHELSKVLLKRRRRRGSIDFETPEAMFRFDDQGLPSKIITKVRLDSHRLVEECMLLANETVAKHIGLAKREEHTKPFVYRVHDAPDPSRLKDLANFVKQFGYSLDVKKGVPSRELQKLLDQVKGTEIEYLINDVTLRSMSKAVYSVKNIGHYGLGFESYTHFTSPIRRYPDLVVHRLLNEYEKGVDSRRREELATHLPSVCRQSSERESVAVQAERASVKVMQVEFMQRHIGDEFDGVIGGVTEFGLFVEINDLLVEGLVRVRDLADDYYIFDEKHYSLRGRTQGKSYRLGDKVRVQVVAVNVEDREIDFAIVA
jgi:ribonuclease R